MPLLRSLKIFFVRVLQRCRAYGAGSVDQTQTPNLNREQDAERMRKRRSVPVPGHSNVECPSRSFFFESRPTFESFCARGRAHSVSEGRFGPWLETDAGSFQTSIRWTQNFARQKIESVKIDGLQTFDSFSGWSALHPMKSLRAFNLLVAPVAANLWLIPFYAYCWRTHEYLGQWPTSKHDHIDVASVFPIHDSLISVSLMVVLYLPFLWLAVAVPMACVRALSRREFFIGIACWIPFLIAVFIDPRGLVWWFID